MKYNSNETINQTETIANSLCKRLSEEQTCAIISLCSNYSIAKSKIQMLKFAYTELICQIDNEFKLDERVLLVHNITKSQAKKLAKELNLSALIIKDQTNWKKINLGINRIDNVFEFKEFSPNNLKELFSTISNEIAQSNKTFELYQVEPPRPSYFQDRERYVKIF